MTPTQTSCTIFKGNPSNLPYICIKFDAPQIGNLIIPDISSVKQATVEVEVLKPLMFFPKLFPNPSGNIFFEV